MEMNKETYEQLTRPFSKEEIQPAPKGKFGSYVPHHLITRRLNEVVPGKWNYVIKEVIRNKDGEIEGAICSMSIDGLKSPMEEIGDVNQNDKKNFGTESELLKLVASDGIKRCAMRFGIGLHLWTGEEVEWFGKEDAKQSKPDASKNSEVKQGNTVKSVGEQLNYFMSQMVKDEKLKVEIQNKAYQHLVKEVDSSERLPEDVEDWNANQMGTFMDKFEVLLNAYNDDLEAPFTDDTSAISNVFGEPTDVSHKLDEGGDEEMSDEWKENPASVNQMKWVNDIIRKATDNNIDGLAELKKLYGDGNITGGIASEIITNWKDKV